MRKIRILVDAHVFDSAYQGTTTYIKGLYSWLVKDPGFEITLAAKNLDNLKKHFSDERFRFKELPSTSKIKRLAFDLPGIIRENKFDFAHFQYITPFKKETKYINTIHDLLFLDLPGYFPFVYRLVKRFTFGYSARKSEIICTVSEYSKKALMNHFKVDEKKIWITPNAVDLIDRPTINVKEKYHLNKYLLFVSRFEPRKNHYGLLRAFIELKLAEQGYSLVFIGRSEDVKTVDYDKYYNSLNIKQKESIRQFENISPDELNSFYAQADLFIYPSLAEGFGIPPLEAAMLSCKVLCSNRTAMKDFDFFGPYLFDPGNAEEFKSKIINTLSQIDYPFESIKNAVISRYNWQNIASDFASKLKEHCRSGEQIS